MYQVETQLSVQSITEITYTNTILFYKTEMLHNDISIQYITSVKYQGVTSQIGMFFYVSDHFGAFSSGTVMYLQIDIY
jgi:hypothetical protein